MDSKVNMPKETECIIYVEWFDEGWTQWNFVISGQMKTAQTQKETLLFCKRDICNAKINI
jgi:hypothetical protein